MGNPSPPPRGLAGADGLPALPGRGGCAGGGRAGQRRRLPAGAGRLGVVPVDVHRWAVRGPGHGRPSPVGSPVGVLVGAGWFACGFLSGIGKRIVQLFLEGCCRCLKGGIRGPGF